MFKLCQRLIVCGVFSLSLIVAGHAFAQQAAPNPPDNPPGLTIHVIQRGENLYRIALRYGTTVQELVDLNGITNAGSILVGQRLLVPAISDEPTIPQAHTVQPGETLATIAELYGVEVQTLLNLNEITDQNRIYPGQLIRLVLESVESAVSTADPDAAATTTATVPTPEETPEETADLGIVSAVTDSNTSIDSDNGSTPFIHTVRPGETLFRIAVSYGLTVNDLASANAIADPTLIYSGQRLIIPNLEVPEADIDLPAPLTRLSIQPLIFKEGETGSIRVESAETINLTGRFLGRELRLIRLDDGNQHAAIIGIPLGTEAGLYPIELFITNADSSQSTYVFTVRIIEGIYGAQNIRLSGDQASLYDPAMDETELNLLAGITGPFSAERFFDGPLSLPAAAAMNAPFGIRRSINQGGFDRFHTGADFATPPGVNVFAAAGGRIVLADLLNIRGNTVVIDHGWGIFTAYAHLSQRLVTVGEIVQTGQVIGTAGSTGRSTGPHLHWEVWVNGIPVNPLQWAQVSFP